MIYEPPVNPPCDVWMEYILPQRCDMKIKDICEDILKRGEKTNYSRIYDALYELVTEYIEDEKFNCVP